jgi:hypothetical protein
MKVEQLIAQYLFINKKVSLQGIGNFEMLGTALTDDDSKTSFPEGAVIFTFDLKANADDGLINFIVEKTRKIKPLAASDLESYTLLGKQFLNIGKPFVIKDLGILLKNQLHQYEFSQGQTNPSKIESNETVIIEKEKSEDEIDFSSHNRKIIPKRNKWLPWTIMIVLLAAILVFYFSKWGYRYFTKSDTQETSELQSIVGDSANRGYHDSASFRKDSTGLQVKDSVKANQADSVPVFFVVVKTASKQSDAQKWFDKLSARSFGKGLILYTDDSTHYKLSMPVYPPFTLSDSIKMRDSLKSQFGKAVIEIRNKK